LTANAQVDIDQHTPFTSCAILAAGRSAGRCITHKKLRNSSSASQRARELYKISAGCSAIFLLGGLFFFKFAHNQPPLCSVKLTGLFVI
jgi:hypothetical protein